jgi:NADPH:quinone reductase-like Zn-dependent oxidoreductase
MNTTHPRTDTTAASADEDTMRSVVQHRYGDVAGDVLTVEQVPRPRVATGEVLVRVRAASIDRGTWHLMAGRPYAIRLAGFGVRRPKHPNPGRSLAGTVVAVGVGVTGFAPGDDVYGITDAALAEYVRVEPGKLARKPAGLSFEAAAAVPISGLTALQAVRDHGGVRSGQSVLVLGASGGVGTFAVQIAKHLGARVTGVSSTGKLDLVRSLGADEVIDYTTDDPPADGRRYDVIIDIGGNRRLRDLRRALTPGGTLVIVGGETDGRWLGGTDRQLRAMALSPFVGQRLGTFISSENAAGLDDLRALIDEGRVGPAVDRTYPLEAIADALDRLVDGRVAGKVVIAVAPSDGDE